MGHTSGNSTKTEARELVKYWKNNGYKDVVMEEIEHSGKWIVIYLDYNSKKDKRIMPRRKM